MTWPQAFAIVGFMMAIAIMFVGFPPIVVVKNYDGKKKE